MKIRLYLDDQRIEPEGWLRVTTAENCIWALQEFAGHIEELSLDHDLDEHVDTRQRGYGEPAVATGYDVAKWLEEKAFHQRWEFIPRVLKCHSQNPKGAEDIRNTFRSIERFKREPVSCTCPETCDCQNPDGNPAGISMYCPIHNDRPDPHPDCPLHGDREG